MRNAYCIARPCYGFLSVLPSVHPSVSRKVCPRHRAVSLRQLRFLFCTCQENALKAISPATLDVLLQILQNTMPSRSHDPHSVSVKQLVLTCLTRLVHVVHSLQPEQVVTRLLLLMV